MDSEGLGLEPGGFIDSPSQVPTPMHTQRRKKPNQKSEVSKHCCALFGCKLGRIKEAKAREEGSREV